MYFDSAAATPLDPQVKKAMIDVLDIYGNENSKHCYGFESRKKIDQALNRIAKILGVMNDQLFITYSGTDSNRRTIKAVAKRFGIDNCYCSAVEHSSILDEINKNNWFDPRGNDWNTLQEKKPKFLALMQANSETGAIYEGRTLREKFPKSLILRDFSQSFAKGIKPDFENCDFGTFAPQKIYGPKMVGILYIKDPEMFREISKDSHTKNVFLAEGAAKSFEIWEKEIKENTIKFDIWQKQIEEYFTKNIKNIKIQEQNSPRISGLINISIKGIRGGELMTILSSEEGIAISTGSACSSDILSPTQVIKYIEKDPIWQFPVRIGLHKFLTDQDIDDFCEIFTHYVKEMRK